MDHADKMEYTSLPEKEAFDSKLSLSSISDVDYTHAKNVWKTFHMQTMGDYHDLYLKLMFFYLLMYLKTLERNA